MRSSSAARSPHGKQPPGRRCRPRRGRVALTLATLASAFLVGACGSSSSSSPSGSSPLTAGAHATGAGPVTRSGSGSGGQSGNTTTGGFSVAFAECMRAHGVPKFPNPNGSAGQLGPGSGVDKASSAYQAALNGPCKSLAPAGWVSSGPVGNGGGS